MVKLVLISWRDIPVESEYSDEQLLLMIRNHGSVYTD